MMRFAVLALILWAFPAVAENGAPDPALAAIFAAGLEEDSEMPEVSDPLARDLLIWSRLRAGNGGFEEYRDFVSRHPDWPGMARLMNRGEPTIPEDLAPGMVMSFFDGLAPEHGVGAVRKASALIAIDREAEAHEVLKQNWLNERLDEEGHDAMVAAFPEVLAPFHQQRVENLLWRWRTEQAAWMLPLLSEDSQALVRARIGYIRKAGNIPARIAEVPEALRDDPGLMYDRYNWLADSGRREEAITVLLEQSVSAEALGDPFRWSGWRRMLARWEMRNGDPERAYQIAAHHFMEEGYNYADLEWLAGYLALTYLKDPTLALNHFETFSEARESPISTSRAWYWIARAYEDLDNPAAASEAFAVAAQHQTAFYGLLAADRLGLPLDPALAGDEVFPDWRGAPFLQEEFTQAALMLISADQRIPAVLFFQQLGKSLERTELAQLGALLEEIEEPFYAVLLGKAAVERGIILPSIYFPLHPMKDMDLPVSAELALSIARRESEFNASAGSPVGALGLMQLMPGTAQEVAGELDLPYSKARLTTDWQYNAALGSTYLASLTERFGNTPPLIAAGYNAGPSRPATWVQEYGDPRLGEIDVVDWIEHIPFRETRNYAQRVSESIPVYRARLGLGGSEIRFREMLIGEKPLIRPRGRPAAVSAGVRPVARPSQ